MTFMNRTGTGEGNQNDLTMHFSLGSHDGPVDVEDPGPDNHLVGAREKLELEGHFKSAVINPLIVIDR